MDNNKFIKEILNYGWKIKGGVKNTKNNIRLPDELFDLCSRFSFLSNSTEDSWIYSIDYYESKLDTDFEWNFFQKSSLECAMSNKQSEDVNKFWSIHIPFFASVKNDYSYISYNKNDRSIWLGAEPEYEDSAEKICDSFDEFKLMIINHLSGMEINENLKGLL